MAAMNSQHWSGLCGPAWMSSEPAITRRHWPDGGDPCATSPVRQSLTTAMVCAEEWSLRVLIARDILHGACPSCGLSQPLAAIRQTSSGPRVILNTAL